MTENPSPLYKLYSLKVILITTFFCGPLAAGILARKNFNNLGKENYGNYALIIGIVSTLLLIFGIFSIPDRIMEKIPNTIIPAIYTGIIFFVLRRYMKEDLLAHQNNNGELYSAWRAVGIGAVCVLILLAGAVGYVYWYYGISE